MHKIKYLLFIVVTVLLISGCSQNNEMDDIYFNNDNTSFKNNSLTIVIPDKIVELDPIKADSPWKREINNFLFDSLVDYDRTTKSFVSSLAEKWDISGDGKQYTFYLKNNISAHNGQKIITEDIKLSIERALNLGNDEIKDMLSIIESINATNDNTVVINLKDNDESFLFKLTHPAVKILALSIKKDENDEKQELNVASNNNKPITEIATGAYKIVENNAYYGIVLEPYLANKDKSHSYDRISIISEKESELAIAEFEKGNADIVHINDKLPEILLKDSFLKKYQEKESFASNIYLGFNISKLPYQDVNLRKAISLCLDRNKIAQATDFYMPSKSLISKELLYNNSTTQYELDKERAKTLISSIENFEQYKDSIELYYVKNDFNEIIAKEIQNQLNDIGISLKTQEIGTKEELDYGIKNGSFSFYLDSFEATTFDLAFYLNYHFGSNGKENNSRYNNEFINSKLIDLKNIKQNSKEFMESVLEVENTLMQDNLFISILEVPNYTYIRKDIKAKTDSINVVNINQ